MTTLDLKTQVAAAVAVRWDDFALRHPHLAGVIDQTLVIENVSDLIAADPKYQAAMESARVAETGLTAVLSIVDGFVIRFIDRLI